MKRYVVVFLVLGLSMAQNSNAQMTEAVWYPIVLNENPVSGDSIFVRLRSFTSSSSLSLGYQVDTNSADSIHVHHCVILGPMAAVMTYDDTLYLGSFDSGSYNLRFTMELRNGSGNCEYYSHLDSSIDFIIKPNTHLGIESLLKDLLVFPNPNSGKLYFDNLDDKKFPISIRIHQINGQVVHVSTINAVQNNRFVLDLTHIPKGMYMIEFQSGIEYLRKKLILE